MIGGFIITGTRRKRVIVRAIGPSLQQFNVPNPLADPDAGAARVNRGAHYIKQQLERTPRKLR